jgi:Cytochrome c552
VIRRRVVSGGVLVGVAVAALIAAREVGGVASQPAPAAARSAPAASPELPPPVGYSNIYARDYVGPDACGDCHDRNHARWQHSLHAAMNRLADRPGAVIGDFGGATLRYGGGAATFTRDARGDAMVLARGGRTRRFHVTRTIGSRYLQEYVGVEEGAPGADEIRLPFGWWRRPGRWLPRPFFDSWYPAEYRADGGIATDPFVPDTQPWATRCAWCHNTYPFELRALRSTERGVGEGLEQYVDLAIERRPPAARAAVVDDNRLPTDELITVGISCESCHLGGRAHAVDEQPIPFVPTSSDLRRRPGAPDLTGGRHNPRVVDHICAQCHSTPAPRYPNGAAGRNSSEALDLLAGACVPQIACTDCHDPHVAGAGEGAPDPPRAAAACIRCHAELASPAAARAHARHGPGVTCLDCHMPKIVVGVSAMVRSHRISSPADPVMLAAAAPNACNLCHLDRSIAWTVRALARGWGARLAPDDGWRLAYGGSLDRPLGPAWLASASHTARVTAAAAYARSPGRRAALPRLIERLDDPVAYYRMFMRFAIDDALGRALGSDEYDPVAAPAVRAAQVRRLAARARAGTL